MVFVAQLTQLLRDPVIGKRIVPIVADEARTFGMQSLFREVAIYAAQGQLYEPEDKDELLFYKESRSGQILEEGITEAGALSSWIAAATSYSTHGVAMLPFYIFYSCFGFSRVGDLILAAADSRARGFLIGATSGRTTLSGEGLQHQDGSSLLAASTIANCRAYDPAFGYELALIMAHGVKRLLDEQCDEFYYLTVTNQNLPQPALPSSVAGLEDGAVRGLYRCREAQGSAPQVRLLGAGAILLEAIAAAELLEQDFGVRAEVWSATSFTELARDARDVQRTNRLQPTHAPRTSHVQRCLDGALPVIAATDHVRALPQLIAEYLNVASYTTLGTDGFGRSDTRIALRGFFEVDRFHIALAALDGLARSGAVERGLVAQAIERYALDAQGRAPWSV
jgi:pyruvate dehydrogenase E1 component